MSYRDTTSSARSVEAPPRRSHGSWVTLEQTRSRRGCTVPLEGVLVCECTAARWLPCTHLKLGLLPDPSFWTLTKSSNVGFGTQNDETLGSPQRHKYGLSPSRWPTPLTQVRAPHEPFVAMRKWADPSGNAVKGIKNRGTPSFLRQLMSVKQPTYLHPVHIDLLLSADFHVGVTLEEFFERTDALDPIERHALFEDVMKSARLRIDEDIEQDEEQSRVFGLFKHWCTIQMPLREVVLTGIVVAIMTRAHRLSEPSYRLAGIEFIECEIEHFEEVGGDGGYVENLRMLAEEGRVGLASDVQVWRRRYDLFCESVVEPLLADE